MYFQLGAVSCRDVTMRRDMRAHCNYLAYCLYEIKQQINKVKQILCATNFWRRVSDFVVVSTGRLWWRRYNGGERRVMA